MFDLDIPLFWRLIKYLFDIHSVHANAPLKCMNRLSIDLQNQSTHREYWDQYNASLKNYS